MKLKLRYNHQFIFVILSFLLLNSISISGQSCYPGGITFSSQAQVDQFPSMNPGCKVIEGNLYINSSSITNLESLYTVEVIEGTFRLNGSSITNFKGLENLDTIKQSFQINQLNTGITSFEGLENLKKIGSSNHVHSFDYLQVENFVGLESLNSISGTLEIKNCNLLISLAGLETLSELDKLSIDDCFSFSSLEGFGNVAELNSLNLEKLQFLESLDGLESITTINNSILIDDNNLLNDISALNNTNLTNIYDLTIRNNSNLSNCDINSICEFIDIDGNLTIHSNNTGCNMLSELVIACCAKDTIWCPEESELCYPEGVSLTSQLQVDLFPVVNPGCKVIGGNLSISGTDITHLDSLNSIEAVHGAFYLFNSAITNFEGLNNIDTIGEEFYIGDDNPNLVNFEGFESLKKIGSIQYDFHNIRSETIVDFTGLDSLETILGILDIKSCTNLTSLSGLGSVTSIDELTIDNCDAFSSMEGFGNNADLTLLRLTNLPAFQNFDGIESIQNISQITLSNLPALTSLDSMSNLTSIDQLFISNCDVLKTLDGLEGLSDIQVFARLQYNDELSDISALENVDLSNINFLAIRNNPNLSYCAINSICDYIDMGGVTDLLNNEIGCNDEMQIEYDCNSLLSIFESTSSLIGSSNNYWHNPSNWKNAAIPGENSFVIIPSDQDCYIQQDSVANCKILELLPNAILTGGSDSQLNVIEE